MFTLIAAYGRSYTNQKQVKEDWLKDKDFLMFNGMGASTYINRQDYINQAMTESFVVRYGKNNEKVMMLDPYKVKPKAKPKAKKTTKDNSKFKQSFDLWMQQVDNRLNLELGVTSDEMPDINYHQLWQKETSVKKAVDKAIANFY